MKGEFEKRIQIMLDEIKETGGGAYYHGAKDLFDSITVIVDEARKEFPIWYKIGDRVFKYNELTVVQRKVAKITGVDQVEAIVFFKKWFGSEGGE